MIDISKFNNKALSKQAFIHRSYLNETKEKVSSNERLEFLGDSILSFVVSRYLFNKYPNFKEGTLTNLRSLLVNTRSLALVARDLNFGDLLILSKGEEESKGRQNQSLLANCFEAFIGALFLDQGILEVEKFLEKTLLLKAEGFVKSKALKDPKSILQEKTQARKYGSPLYKVVNEEGPAHNRTFTIAVYVNNSVIAHGMGRSKKLAEEDAAKKALDNFKKAKVEKDTGK